ncbi:MAG: tRNA pseudouridine synthase [Candidatus Peribacteria bacterium]|nr:tRNA pseudouridine synthase [Candidatus Peribacteria bacterium]
MRHGFLLIDKSVGPTSHDIVGQARRVLHEKSIGHLGTLDPAASGLMVLAVGKKALKVVELFVGLDKEYEAAVKLGAVSSTYDRDGIIDESTVPMGWTVPEEAIVRRTIADRFTGTISQVPPAHSAVKIDGRRAYDMARKGQEVIIAPREVTILECSVLNYAYPQLDLRIRSSSGTYIRSLAHDLGQVLHCGGYLAALRRTKVGAWTVADAVQSDAVTWSDVFPLKEVLAGLPRLDVSDDEYQNMQHGKDLPYTIDALTIAWHAGLPVAVLEHGKQEGTVHARKVF